MEITTKIKLAAVGLAALVCGCYSPINHETLTISVPKECARIKSLNYDGYSSYWNLTCETESGTDIFYRKNVSDLDWRRYSIEKE